MKSIFKKTVNINGREKIHVEISASRDGKITMANAVWAVNERPMKGWSGISHRNPEDPQRGLRGTSLAVYRLMTAMQGEFATILAPHFPQLFKMGLDYTLNGYEDE